MKDIPDIAWLTFATIGIWIGVGLGCSFSHEHAGAIAGAGVGGTALVWIFGRM